MWETGGPSDDAWGGGPPPPADRLWRHPSEMAPPPPPTAVQRSHQPGRYSLGTVVVAGSLGALLMFGSLVATGLVGGTTSTVDSATPTTAAAVSSPTGAVTVRYTDASGSVVGAGLVVDGRGDVVTTLAVPQVVPAGSSLTVSGSGGTWTSAAPVGSDPLTGLAVIRSTTTFVGSTPPTVASGATGRPSLGEALELVHPDGPAPASTAHALVSSVAAVRNDERGTLVGLLVLTTPGSSAAPPVAVAPGSPEVAALVLPDDDPDDEMVHAVPASTALAIGRRISATGTVTHGTLDASVTERSGELVVADADATSGLVAGDVILAIEGRSVSGWLDMVAALLDRAPGDTATVSVVRDRRQRTVTSRVTDGSTIGTPGTVATTAATIP